MVPSLPTAGPNTIRTLQATTILLASTASGLGLGLSFFSVPRLLELPTHLLIRQFNATLDVSHKVMPPLLLLPGVLHGVLAYLLKTRAGKAGAAAAASSASWSWTGGPAGSGLASASTSIADKLSSLFRNLPAWKVHAAAAVLTFSILPYTFVVMKPLNRMMSARGKYVRDLKATSSSSSAAASSSSSSRSKSKRSKEEDVEVVARRELESAELGAMRRGELSSHAVVDRWAMVNLYRPVISLVAAGVSVYAALW